MNETELKKGLRLILERHEGSEKAITGGELASLFGFRDDRKIRQAIRELIKDGLPVASLVEKPYGYFVIMNKKQADDYAASIKNRLIEDAKRRRDFRVAAAKWLMPAVQREMKL